MRLSIRPILTVLAGIAAVVAGVIWMNRAPGRPAPLPAPDIAADVVIDNTRLAEAGIALANQYTGEVGDTSSLEELQAALAQRGPAALAALQKELADVE